MAASEFVFVYSTVPNRLSAQQISEMLVRAGLAACVNIHGPMNSVYNWKDQLEIEEEFALFIKTRRSLADQVVESARKLHPYSVPCFLILPIESGNADYLDWARAQTEQQNLA